ncbi:hypothetical protein Micbo1qcDRAFT_13136 [Microdochium bolleyi]|uniref:Zn(2)-C6 fungal-type domain-containing protein n=1 Tax=Microdochium bolleyi TaxID=196109 RepID=A0A136IX94_9PEZI|nr:hypothetical protein Micbo1qcDRAFT_13136 [Microdochium bolleyi]
MVFGGRFNSACHLCRKRRVKCDEGRPGCRRCEVYRQPCPGYSDTFHFAHQQSKPQSQPESQIRSRRRAVPAPVAAAAASAALAPVLDPPEELVSLCYFMNRFACRAECAGLPGYLNFLYTLYDSSNHGVLELATLSAARMVAFNRTGHRNKALRDKAYSDHGVVVSKIRELLLDEARLPDNQDGGDAESISAAVATRQALSDRTLGTVLMLSIFGLVNDDAARYAGSHAPGVYYLLTRRGQQQAHTSRGREMMFLCIIYLQADATMRNDFRYCRFSSMGILPDGKPAVDPMTQVVPKLATLCRLSKPLRGALFMPEPLAVTPEVAFPYPSYQSGSNFSSPAELGTTEIEAMFPTPTDSTTTSRAQTPHPLDHDRRLEQIRGGCVALHDFGAWDYYATQNWSKFYEGRIGPPLLGQSRSHARLYHSETASTVVLMRSYRTRFSLLLLAVCEQTIRELGATSGPSTLDDKTDMHQNHDKVADQALPNWSTSLPLFSSPCYNDPADPVIDATADTPPAAAGSLRSDTVTDAGREELLRVAQQTISKLEHEIPLAIDDMMHCIPFVLCDVDPVTGSVLKERENAPADKGFEMRDALGLIVGCTRFATDEQRRQSWINLVRVHEIAGMRLPELKRGMMG